MLKNAMETDDWEPRHEREEVETHDHLGPDPWLARAYQTETKKQPSLHQMLAEFQEERDNAPILKELPVDREARIKAAEYQGTGTMPDFTPETVIDEEATAARNAARARERAEEQKARALHKEVEAQLKSMGIEKPTMHYRPTEQHEIDRENEWARDNRTDARTLPSEMPDERRYAADEAKYKKAYELARRRVEMGIKVAPGFDQLKASVQQQSAARTRRGAGDDRSSAATRQQPRPSETRAEFASPRRPAPSRAEVEPKAAQSYGRQPAAAEPSPSRPRRYAADERADRPVRQEARTEPTRSQPSSVRTRRSPVDEAPMRPERGPDAPQARPRERADAGVKPLLERSVGERMNALLANVDLKSITSHQDENHLRELAIHLSAGTQFQASAEKLDTQDQLGRRMSVALKSIERFGKAMGFDPETLLRQQPGAVMQFILDKDSRALSSAIREVSKQEAPRDARAAGG
ncbi:MAG TPA: hypothetical protein VFR90_08325 [Methylibium sp.]|uniref:hypothetical protein n=1 Tax=Methylibium sp. TaxID=2067992 RepID=UPI002DBCF69F|nr:hypothetical protein [Methylibium sp.]HEU4459111.1 hypothetical protein [Methylibium sp.]